MNQKISAHEVKAVGWYALWWTQITDWYKRTHKRESDRASKASHGKDSKKSSKNHSDDKKDKGRPQTIAEFAEDKEQSAPAMNYAKHALEESQQRTISAIESKRLETAVEESNDILIRAETVVPFTLFPTTITVDRHKLTLIYRQFFKVEQTVSVPIENIKNIEANFGPFFGSLTITSDNFVNNTQTVNYLSRQNAKKIQKMVQGAMVAVNEEINVSKVPVKKLRGLLEDLGGAHAVH